VRAQLGAAEAGYWPTVNLPGSYARQKQSENQPIIGSIPLPPNVSFENNVYQAGFDASWEIDLFGGTRRAVEAASADLAALQYGRRDVLVSVLSEVARQYVLTRGAQRELALARDQIRAQEETVAITRGRVEHGAGTELDLQRALALEATLRSQVPVIETSIESSIHRLGVLLGHSRTHFSKSSRPLLPSRALHPSSRPACRRNSCNAARIFKRQSGNSRPPRPASARPRRICFPNSL